MYWGGRLWWSRLALSQTIPQDLQHTPLLLGQVQVFWNHDMMGCDCDHGPFIVPTKCLLLPR